MFTNLINRAADEDRVLFNLIGCFAILAAAFFLGTESASAHLLDGKTPSTFAEGLLSGVGHPIIGPDYLAFLLALGIAVGVFRLSFFNPFLFVAAMICGVTMHVAGLYLPAADLIVPVSVLIAGLMLIIEERIPPAWWMAVFVAAGIFHGYSYGDFDRRCGTHTAYRLPDRACRGPSDNDGRGGIRDAWIMEALEHGAAARWRRLLWRRVRRFGH